MSGIDTGYLRQWIGREQVSSEVLTSSLVGRFNAIFDRVSGTETGDAAPLLIHLCLCQPAAAQNALGADGHPKTGDFLPPVPLPNRMWAGGQFEFHASIRIGDVVQRRSTVRDVVVKKGRTGTLCFVTVEHVITSDGRRAVTEIQDIVYRDASRALVAQRGSKPAQQGDYRFEVDPTPSLLFRYSAITFNGHRIHYDAHYARDVEGYPGLVVHGPLQATLLCQMSADIRNREPSFFRFRSLSPLFDTAVFSLNAEEADGGVRSWTATDNGPVAMEGFAKWP